MAREQDERMSINTPRNQKDGVVWEIGETELGSETHLIDFQTDSMLARGRGEPDKMLCGHVGDFQRAPGEPVSCSRCQKRMAQNAIAVGEVRK